MTEISIRSVDDADDRRRFYTPRSLAQRLAISERLAYELLASGELASYKIRGARRIDPEDVDRYLRVRREEGYE
jgi:excisionase family DNA binding protein